MNSNRIRLIAAFAATLFLGFMLGLYTHKKHMDKRIHEVQRIYRPGDLAERIIHIVDANGKQKEDIRTIIEADMPGIKAHRKRYSKKNRELMKQMFDKIHMQLDSEQSEKLNRELERMKRKRKKGRKPRSRSEKVERATQP